MAKEMSQTQIFARAKMLRGMANFTVKLRNFKEPICSVRSVKTKHGDVRVLEYSFDSKEPKPLFIDMHGGGFILMTAESDDELNRYFLSRIGARIISIDSPKAPENPYPCAVEAMHEVCLHYSKKRQGVRDRSQACGNRRAQRRGSFVDCRVPGRQQ
jgi:acetyl esterase